ncbi:MAG: hypothetical protein M1816_001676 [Peltula sp. TS41687]|nr:MAG: hypothetical protein M1816_001676 [Peltula sp. TS41687]
MDTSRVRKHSYIYSIWRVIKTLYRWDVGMPIDAVVNEEVFNYITNSLVEKHQLDFSVRDKLTLSVNDLVSLLHYHWALDTSIFPNERQRLQLSFLLLVLAYTGARPGAIVECGLLRGSNKALRYRDVDLIVLRDPDNPQYRILVMIVRVVLNKGERDNENS